MANLLKHLQIERADVADWQSPIKATVVTSRAKFLNQALIPAKVTNHWKSEDRPNPEALHGVTLLEAYNDKEEAGMIALALRKVLEIKGKTAALVTPNRTLARRVAAELKRWQITIDDSAGRPLTKTPPGTFMRQCAQLAAGGLAPITLLSLLKHPYAAGGMDTTKLRKQVRQLEIKIRCGSQLGNGFAALKASVNMACQKEDKELKKLINKLEKIITPFALLFETPQVSLIDLLINHVKLAEELATTNKKAGHERLWAGKDGEELALFFTELKEAANALGSIETRHYPALIDVLLSTRVTDQSTEVTLA